MAALPVLLLYAYRTVFFIICVKKMREPPKYDVKTRSCHIGSLHKDKGPSIFQACPKWKGIFCGSFPFGLRQPFHTSPAALLRSFRPWVTLKTLKTRLNNAAPTGTPEHRHTGLPMPAVQVPGTRVPVQYHYPGPPRIYDLSYFRIRLYGYPFQHIILMFLAAHNRKYVHKTQF